MTVCEDVPLIDPLRWESRSSVYLVDGEDRTSVMAPVTFVTVAGWPSSMSRRRRPASSAPVVARWALAVTAVQDLRGHGLRRRAGKRAARRPAVWNVTVYWRWTVVRPIAAELCPRRTRSAHLVGVDALLRPVRVRIRPTVADSDVQPRTCHFDVAGSAMSSIA
jgi:hypothetical protein